MDEPRFEPAPQDEVLKDEEALAQLLEALGHPEAWVTDESRIGDFVSGKWENTGEKRVNLKGVERPVFRMIPGSDEPALEALSTKLGFRVDCRDSLVEVCKKISAKELKS